VEWAGWANWASKRRAAGVSWAVRGIWLLGWIGPKLGEEKETFANFSKEYKQLNSNTGLNSANQKLCSSMNATINSYGSLI
jgi:hypothetical protein